MVHSDFWCSSSQHSARGTRGGKPGNTLIVTVKPTIYLPTLIFEYKVSIYHECEGGIEKSVLRITDWHHKACRVITIGDHKGRIFLSHPHTHDGYFFLLTT